MVLKDKVAIVTGAGRGIGRAIALKLANLGANVVVNDINNSATQVVDEIKSKGRQSLAAIANVCVATDVNKMVEETKNTFGKIDILVNNAGIARDQLAVRMSDEEWDTVLNTNLRSVFLCSRAVLRHMLRQRAGKIINISSIVGIVGNPGQANYAAAKAGIIGLTKTLAKEVGSRQINVNAIAPGFIDTELTQRLPDEWKKELQAKIPLGFFGSTNDVADAVAFLASDEARYITGQVICVDGGMAGTWL